MLWKEILTVEFEEAVQKAKGVCAIPIGCVERHGHHLPLGCDTIVAAEITRRAAEMEPVVVFPEMYFGEKAGAGEFPGTIIFPSDLIAKILEQSCLEIARNGFHKIILMNYHGGNVAMLENFARSVLHKKANFQVFVFHIPNIHPTEILEEKEKYPTLTEEDFACLKDYADQKKKDGHGGFRETALCYAASPKHCRLDKMNEVDGTSIHLFDGFSQHKIYSPLSWAANFPNSLSCDYHAGLNERIAEVFANRSAEKCAEVFRFLKEETASEEYLKSWLEKQ
ncbi:MAG: creatininase family protein [Clostridia bacterium]|nr:creatininase family protein [Clostridia bacterium]